MKCIACGADISFNPKTGKLKCDYCRSEFDPKEYNKEMSSAKKISTYTGHGYKCSSCGAELLVFDETAATFCSYCGSNSIIEEKLITQEKPDYVIPFKISKEDAKELFKKELDKYHFLPKFMKEDTTIEKIRGIYLPYAIYRVNHDGPATLKGVTSHRVGDYIITDHYDVNFDLKLNYEGMSFDLLSKFYDRYSDRVAPFDFNQAEKFNINYLDGFYADCKDLDANLYDEDVVDFVSEDALNRILKSNFEFTKKGCRKNGKLSLKVTDRKYAYFPVYFLAIRDNKNKKLLYAVINGQTGEVVMDMPIDFKKYLLYGLIASIVTITLTNLLCSFKPVLLILFCFIYFLYSLFSNNKKLNKVYRIANNLDDRGVQKGNHIDKKKKNTMSLFSKVFIIVILGIFLVPTIATFFDVLLEVPLSNVQSVFYIDDEVRLYNTIGVISFISIIVFAIAILINKNNKKNDSYNFKHKFKYLWKQLLGLLILSSLYVWTPVYDEYFYIMSFVLFALTILLFKDLIDEQNLLCQKELPQLDKRGGDK